MISIVIALLLVLGISQIFSIAQRTTGAGTQVLASIETNRAIQSTLNDDFRNMVNGDDSPGLVIVSYAVPAFRNRPDQQQDRDGQPNTINDTAGNGSLKAMNWSDVNYRMHRVDRICFFTRGSFHRQTADAPSYVSGTASNEAFVWLGHLALPNNLAISNWDYRVLAPAPKGGYFAPAAAPAPGAPAGPLGNNDNSYFASDWILGRQVVLLTPPPTNNGALPESGYSARIANPLSLLDTRNRAGQENAPLYASRYDLAYTTIDLYRQLEGTSNVWWEGMSGVQPSGSVLTLDQRYWANPFPQKPRGPALSTPQQSAAWMSAATAQTTPIFIRGCTQFIVEFAGDFVTQNADGSIPKNGNQPDGQIDFDVDPNPKSPTYLQKRVRWYGFPRDSNDEGTIGVTTVQGSLRQFGVCPLRDTYGGPAAVERMVPPPLANYANWQSTYNANTPYSQPYVVAWGPDTAGFPKPKMIRITIAVDDPAGHLNTEQTYEYVFNLP